jgi:hypothetical protein
MSLANCQSVLFKVCFALKHVSFTYYLNNFYQPINSLEYE